MENLPAMQGHEETTTSLNPAKFGGKIARAIHRLRYDMRRQQPVNKVRRQLEEIQTDYDKVVGLLTELYKYTNEAQSAILTEWESALRDDLLSIEHDVRNYDQEKQMSTEEQTDTSVPRRSVAQLRDIDGYKYVKSHHGQIPLSDRDEGLQQQTVTWLGTPLQHDSSAGSEPANWDITLMIPEIFTEKFQKSVELNRKWFNDQGVDSVEVNGRTIDLTDDHATDAVGYTADIGDINKPPLRFTETSDGDLRITGEGSVVEAEDLSRGCRAVTDGRFRAGRYYWELQITCSPNCVCVCHVGVVQESCGLRPDTNPDRHSWYIEMVYSDDKVKCTSFCGGEIKPDYLQGRPHTGPHHVGLYLDCDKRSLTILDSGQNKVIATVRGLKVTEPLVPCVRFSGGKSRSARLVTGDSATLPQVLCDMLNTS